MRSQELRGSTCTTRSGTGSSCWPERGDVPASPDQPVDPEVADLGYRILRRHWRQGFATEASHALIRHGFRTVGVTRVIARTMAVNAASRGVMTAVGMSHVRTYFPRWDAPLPGADQGEVEYELTLADWQSRASG